MNLARAASLLGCLALSGCVGTAQAQRIARAEATLEAVQRLDAALSRYAEDHRGLPAGDLESLAQRLVDTEAPDGSPYLVFPPSVHLRGGGPYDSWDRLLRMIVPAAHAGHAADVYSTGEDGVDDAGTGDDISSWDGFARERYAVRFNRVDLALVGGWSGTVLAALAAGLAVRFRRGRARTAGAIATAKPNAGT